MIGGKSGEFERGIEDFEQVFRAQASGSDILFLFLAQRRFQQQIGHAENAAERSPNFVIQAREELALSIR